MSLNFKYNYPQIARDSGFKLRQFRDGPLDWRLVGSLEVERILREQQFEHIDAILFYLSEAPLGSMLESNVLDSGIAKYFILSQLAIQYLIFCRKFLDETVRTLRESLAEVDIENVNLKSVNQDHSNEILHLHKKISQMEALNDVVFPCHMCTKNFVSNDALNIHLSKKHSKSPTGEAQGKDNDRTLIDTIKLELEIKQLKERLNIAEKDIRETVENKKVLPVKFTKTCSSTQINTLTNDVGTQSNLVETKESDCFEDVQSNKLEILSQLQEKISKLENWQETQCTGNQQSIDDITRKLSEITESLKSRSEQDVENLRKITKDVISSSQSSNQNLPPPSADELQTLLSNTVSKALHLNSQKLNEILTKIETIYEEKVPSPRTEIQTGRYVVQDPIKEVKILPSIAPVKPTYIEEHSFEEIDSSTPQNQGTYNIAPIRCSKETESDGSTDDISREILESHESDDECLPLSSKNADDPIPNATYVKLPIKTLEKQMSEYGLKSITKTMSASEVARVSAQLTESRNSLKKIYPRFYATRNKLKSFVDRISLKKQLDGEYSPSLPEFIKLKQSSKTEISSKHKRNANYPEMLPSKNQSNDAFKKRLEKILSSPIKKPTTYISKHVNESTKPVPVPRKRVVFYSGKKSTTGDEFPVSAPRFKHT